MARGVSSVSDWTVPVPRIRIRERRSLQRARRLSADYRGEANGVFASCIASPHAAIDDRNAKLSHVNDARRPIMSSQNRRFAESVAFSDSWASAGQFATMPIPDLLRGLEAIVVAVIARDGALKDANQGFLVLMTGSGTSAPEPTDVRYMFVSPRFDEIAGRRTDRFDRTIYRGLLSLGAPGGKMTSLRGAIHSYGPDYVLVAEHDIRQLATLRGTVLELQDDLATKQRQILQLEHEIAQLQELADAALRDRATLLDALAHGAPARRD